MRSSSPGLHPPHARSSPSPSCDKQAPRHRQVSPGGQNHPRLGTSSLNSSVCAGISLVLLGESPPPLGISRDGMLEGNLNTYLIHCFCGKPITRYDLTDIYNIWHQQAQNNFQVPTKHSPESTDSEPQSKSQHILKKCNSAVYVL